jgi:hypothetical protein
MTPKSSRLYLMCMSLFWLVFGLITAFYPALMDLFQTSEGVAAKTIYSNHIWSHDGFDIIAFCILLYTLAGEVPSRRMIRGVAIAASMPAIAIFYSYFSTPYWNPLFLVAGAGCLAFVIWGLAISSRPEINRASRDHNA